MSQLRWSGRSKYNDPVWEPFWAACEDLGLPLVIHAGNGDPDDLPGSDPIWMFESQEITRHPINRVIFSGVFDRRPGLKLVITESPGRWWHNNKLEFDSLYWQLQNLQRKPGEYMDANVFVGVSFQSRFEAVDATETGYGTTALWGSDYPHIEGTWHFLEDKSLEPYSHRCLRYTYHDLDPEKVKAILGLNAINVYGLDIDSLSDLAQKINAPTFSRINEPLAESDIPTDGGLFAFRTVGAFS